jgi:hypothetical protein
LPMTAQPYRADERGDPYALAWKTLRRRRLYRHAAVLTFLPVVFLAKAYLGRAVLFVLAIHFVLVLVTTIRAACFRCPRCQNLFSMERIWSTRSDAYSATRCKHCGLTPVA